MGRARRAASRRASPTPVDADFLRRQRRDAAAIPLRVWLAVAFVAGYVPDFGLSTLVRQVVAQLQTEARQIGSIAHQKTTVA